MTHICNSSFIFRYILSEVIYCCRLSEKITKANTQVQAKSLQIIS